MLNLSPASVDSLSSFFAFAASSAISSMDSSPSSARDIASFTDVVAFSEGLPVIGGAGSRHEGCNSS